MKNLFTKSLPYFVLTLFIIMVPIVATKSLKTRDKPSEVVVMPFPGENKPTVRENKPTVRENKPAVGENQLVSELSAKVDGLNEALQEREKQIKVLEKKVWLLVIVNNENQTLNSRLEGETSREERERIFFDYNWKINKLPETMDLNEDQEERLRNELSDAEEGDSKYKPIIYTKRTKLQANKWYKTGDKGVLFWDGENWIEVKPEIPRSAELKFP